MNEIIKLYLYVNVHRTEQNFIYLCCCCYFNCLFLVVEGVWENVPPTQFSFNIIIFLYMTCFYRFLNLNFHRFFLFYFILFFASYVRTLLNIIIHPNGTHTQFCSIHTTLYRHMFPMLFE